MSFSTGDWTILLRDFFLFPNGTIKRRWWAIDNVDLNGSTSHGENIAVFND